MDEILRELRYAFSRRDENIGLTWSLMRGVFDRHSNLLETMATTPSFIHQHNHQTIAETELLKQIRQFYHHQTISIALLFLNVQYEFVTESISPQLIDDTLRLFDTLDPETIKYGASEGTSIYLIFLSSPHLFAIVVNISHKVATLACQEGIPQKLIRPFLKLNYLLCPNHSHLNSLDADFLQVCISAHMYSFALNFLANHQFDQLEPNLFPLSPVDLLRFFYYSGVVFISAKQFKNALQAFDQVLAVPAGNVSTIAVEAYKKATLVSLILSGKKYQIPRSLLLLSLFISLLSAATLQISSRVFTNKLNPTVAHFIIILVMLSQLINSISSVLSSTTSKIGCNSPVMETWDSPNKFTNPFLFVA
jgi:hypothetical protein